MNAKVKWEDKGQFNKAYYTAFWVLNSLSSNKDVTYAASTERETFIWEMYLLFLGKKDKSGARGQSDLFASLSQFLHLKVFNMPRWHTLWQYFLNLINRLLFQFILSAYYPVFTGNQAIQKSKRSTSLLPSEVAK